MIIDIHAHISHEGMGPFLRQLGRQPFTTRILLERMDMEGIDKSVLLPLANPENADDLGVAGNMACLRAARRHPDRLMAFCGMDPRNLRNTPKADLSVLLRAYRDAGFKGIGEMCANLPITDPRYKNLFHHAGQEHMPLLFHFASREGGLYGAYDELHLPGLEQVLKEFPSTVFIGHSPCFWGEIDGHLKPEQREGYPKGSIRKPGRLWRLLEACPNLYGDLSAGSGFFAISRDPEAGYTFLQKFNRKLFFGTDRFTSRHEPVPPMLLHLKDALRKGKLTKEAYENVMHRNFERVFSS